MSAAGATDRFGRALASLYGAIDWRRIGEPYCTRGGGEFFGAEDREALLDAGLRLAADLGEALESLAGGVGRSLYVGAAVAELPVVLFESIVAGRRVEWTRLAGGETDELARALAQVERELDVALPRPRATAAVPSGPFDVLWFASVLTDPDVFPALHDELYGRAGTELAVGGGSPEAERERARGLVADGVGGLRPPALLVTSDEELPFFEEAARRRGLALAVPPAGRTSAIVGDVLRFCSVSSR